MTNVREVGARRGEIVAAALDLLGATPLESLTTRAIAAALGLTQPALFRHFASRAELVAAVVAHARALLGARAAQALALDAPAALRLRALFRGLCEQVEATPGLPRLVFADAASVTRASGHELAGLAAMHRSIAAELAREGQADGSIGAAADPHVVGAAFAALAQGAVLGWQLEGRPPGLAARAAPLLDLVLAGAAPARPASSRARRPAPAARRRRAVVDAAALLARGLDPLAATLAAVARVGPGGVVVLRAPFRPAPLVAVLERGGHAVAERPGPGTGHTVLVTVAGAPAPERHPK
jgi:AcrR family transcriptional regulator